MQAAEKLIVGNWKMHGDPAMARAWVETVAKQAGGKVIVCPPATLLGGMAALTAGTRIALGAQDCHEQPEGAFTGDIGAPMLKAAGCSHVIVGHSERRSHHGETSELVRRKAARAIKSGLVPIVCIGETLAEREGGRTEEVLKTQLQESLPEEVRENHFILAYEPVWAIGSGRTPAMGDIARAHGLIVAAAAARTGLAPERISVLYGGSVNAANAGDILATAGVAGVLVGGASLKPEEFCKIIGIIR